MDRQYYVYIITNANNTVLYTGMTSGLQRRMYEHKNNLIPGFSSKYQINKLVYFENTGDVTSAINREKQIKAGSRRKKIELIEKDNKEWKDLSEEWI